MFAFVRSMVTPIALVTLLSINANGQETNARDNLTVAQQFVRAVFPDLKGRHLKAQVSLTDDLDRDWSGWAIGSMSVHAHDPQSSTHSRRILSGRFQFIEGRVQEAHFDGEYVSSELSGKIAAEVTNNKDWTAADMTRAFGTAGARFASQSSDEFLREIKFERFETLLGRVSDLRARFIAVPPIRASETDPEFKPFWLVTIETISRPDVRRRYYLTFELFNGRLTSLVELK